MLFLAKRSILFQHFIRVMTQLFFHCDYRCVQIGDLALKLGFLAFQRQNAIAELVLEITKQGVDEYVFFQNFCRFVDQFFHSRLLNSAIHQAIDLRKPRLQFFFYRVQTCTELFLFLLKLRDFFMKALVLS